MSLLAGLLLVCGVAQTGVGQTPSATSCAIPSEPRVYDQALCLAREQAPLQAAAYLLAARQRGDADLLWQRSNHLLAVLYQNLGLLNRAAALADDEHTPWPERLFSRFQLGQARAWMQRDALDQAESALRRMRFETDSAADLELAEQRQSLIALAQMHQQDYMGAVNTLEDKQSFPKRDLVGHYNYAVALVRAGRVREGLALLDEVGTAEAGNEVERAIRDRANLQLGYVWLRDKKGATARPIFKRIRLDGPYSNKALLGLGWAELAPDDEPQEISFDRTLFCPDIKVAHPQTSILLFYTRHSAYCRNGRAYPFRMIHQFAFEPGEADSDKTNYRSALKYWTELSRRDIREPAVQEALLVTGYAYHQAGALDRAAQAYLAASVAFREESARRKLLMRALAYSANNPLELIRRPSFSAYFDNLRSSARFDLLAGEDDQLRQIQGQLASLENRTRDIMASHPKLHAQARKLQYQGRLLDNAVINLRGRLQAQLRRDVLAALERQNEDLLTYQRQAQIALTQLYTAAD